MTDNTNSLNYDLLKNCPFCDTHANLFDYSVKKPCYPSDDYLIQCGNPNCFAEMSGCNIGAMIIAWNRRDG